MTTEKAVADALLECFPENLPAPSRPSRTATMEAGKKALRGTRKDTYVLDGHQEEEGQEGGGKPIYVSETFFGSHEEAVMMLKEAELDSAEALLDDSSASYVDEVHRLLAARLGDASGAHELIKAAASKGLTKLGATKGRDGRRALLWAADAANDEEAAALRAAGYTACPAACGTC